MSKESGRFLYMSTALCKENGVFFNMNKTAHDINVGSK
jgi:hypothetical protein